VYKEGKSQQNVKGRWTKTRKQRKRQQVYYKEGAKTNKDTDNQVSQLKLHDDAVWTWLLACNQPGTRGWGVF
jgi:hypothetical protein